MKTIIKVTETSVAYFAIEHTENEDPKELFQKFYDFPWNDEFIADELEKGYEGREIEVSHDDINTEYIPTIAREECEVE